MTTTQLKDWLSVLMTYQSMGANFILLECWHRLAELIRQNVRFCNAQEFCRGRVTPMEPAELTFLIDTEADACEADAQRCGRIPGQLTRLWIGKHPQSQTGFYLRINSRQFTVSAKATYRAEEPSAGN